MNAQHFNVLALLIICSIVRILGHSSLYQSLPREDPAVSIKFPKPRHFENEQNVPIGHFESLGVQRSPVGQIPEYFESISPRSLWEKHVKLYRPAVFRGMLKESPALSHWNDDYLIKTYGDLEVLVEKKLEDRKSGPKRMSIEAFLHQYKHENWYVVSILPNAMKKDVKVPKPLMCSSLQSNLMELNLWIGTKGTRSMLHYDADNILHCLVAGRKDWILIHPRNKFLSDMAYGDPGQQSGFSLLNVDHINVYNSPDVSDIPWEYASLLPGDCLYVPPGYMHQVRSYNRSISTTFLFYPHEHFDDDDCVDVDLDSYKSLNELFVYWDYVKGQETVDMGYKNPLEIRRWILHAYKLLNLSSVTWWEFAYVFARIDGSDLQENHGISRKEFDHLDLDGDGLITYEEVENADVEAWKKICRDFDNPHGPTKSQMDTDMKLSNASSHFNPRSHSHYIESLSCGDFLLYMLEKYGVNGSIAFPRFAKAVTFQLATPAQAFAVLDRDMDGNFTRLELENTCKEKLKKVYSMKYGFTSADDNVDQFLPDLDDDGDDDISFPIMNLLRNLMTSLDEDGVNSAIDLQTFSKFFYNHLRYGNDVIKIDTDFMFKILDRSKKGFVTSSDIKDCLESSEPVEEPGEVAEGIVKARTQNFVAGVTYGRLFRQLMEVLMAVQVGANPEPRAGSPGQSRDEL